MFTVYVDNKELWSPNSNDRKLLNPTVDLGVNKAGSFSFRILPDHKFYDAFVKMKSIITVIENNRTIFKGRVFSDPSDFRKIKKIEAEGLLSYFNDSIVRPYEFQGSVEEYVDLLIDQHNAQVEPSQKFILGRVTVTDPNDYITRQSSDFPMTWSEITAKLINKLGGYIVIRYESDGNYIDYLEDYTDTSLQEIKYSVNLLDLDRSSSGEDLITCIIPYGHKDDDTGSRVTISSVNDGLDYLVDETAAAQYGRISRVVIWEDVLLPANLKRKAQEYLAEKVLIATKLTIKALDLHLADNTVEPFKLGDYIRVYSEPHGINQRVLLTAYKMDLSDPKNCTITLGIEKSSYLGDVASDRAQTNEIIRQEIGNATEAISDQILSESRTYVNTQIDNAQENTRTMLGEYVLITELNQYKESVSTQFTQNNESFTMLFNSLSERITEENGEISNQVTELSKYIRYVDGAIIIGEVGNTLSTKIANGRISFIYNDSLEVAYITDSKLYITQAEVLEQIIIGNFAFIPRANGNLSFKKI